MKKVLVLFLMFVLSTNTAISSDLKNIDSWGDGVNFVTDSIGNVISDIVDAYIDPYVEVLKKLMELLPSFLESIANAIIDGFVSLIKNIVNGIVQGILGTLNSLLGGNNATSGGNIANNNNSYSDDNFDFDDNLNGEYLASDIISSSIGNVMPCPYAPCVYAPKCSYSVSAKSGYDKLKSYIKKANKKLQDYWDSQIKTSINKVKEQTEKRKENLVKLKELERERLVVSKQIEFLLRQESEFVGNIINIEGESTK